MTTTDASPTPTTLPDFLAFSENVEIEQENEKQINDEINQVMADLNAMMLDRFRHGIRSVHAKSHGLLRADLTVYDGLPDPLRQGLFARAATYPAILRFSTNPGDILPDSISTPRGLAVKVLGVEGEMLPDNAGAATQDFVMASGKAFSAKDAGEFLKTQQLIAKNAKDDPLTKQAVSDAARGANAVLTALGHESAKLEGLGYPKSQVLAETYGTQTAIRYGDFFGKIIVTPLSENLKQLEHERFHTRGHYSALRENIQEFFKTETAEWEVQVQLCVDLEKMPVEDASQLWPEDLSPYVPVAKLVAAPQETYSSSRRVYVDDHLSFNPWHTLAAHRPLGNIMRARRVAYAAARAQRADGNAIEINEPTGIESLPD